jgi:glycogen debranching enzyme
LCAPPGTKREPCTKSNPASSFVTKLGIAPTPSLEQAQALRGQFNEAFWNPREGTFALALDGRKRQVASVTSNPGHCLYCGIVEPEKASAVAERLMAPDMFCGWGSADAVEPVPRV